MGMWGASGLILALALAVGCSSKPELETWPVHGTVVDQKGKPVVRGAIQFQCNSDQYLNMSGATGEDGSYSMRSFRKGEIYQGAVAGTYKVIVIHGDTGSQYDVPEPFTVEAKDNEYSVEIKR